MTLPPPRHPRVAVWRPGRAGQAASGQREGRGPESGPAATAQTTQPRAPSGARRRVWEAEPPGKPLAEGRKPLWVRPGGCGLWAAAGGPAGEGWGLADCAGSRGVGNHGITEQRAHAGTHAHLEPRSGEALPACTQDSVASLPGLAPEPHSLAAYRFDRFPKGPGGLGSAGEPRPAD